MKKAFLVIIMAAGYCMAQVKPKDVFDVARTGTVEEMQLLVKTNSDTINKLNHSGFSPLILACYRGNVPVAEYLAAKVRDINYNSPSGTALAAVAVKGNVILAKLLLENGANPDLPDAMGMTPLLYAAQFENKDMVTVLLKHKANKKIANNEGKTAMDYAVFNKNQEIINLLK